MYPVTWLIHLLNIIFSLHQGCSVPVFFFSCWSEADSFKVVLLVRGTPRHRFGGSTFALLESGEEFFGPTKAGRGWWLGWCWDCFYGKGGRRWWLLSITSRPWIRWRRPRRTIQIVIQWITKVCLLLKVKGIPRWCLLTKTNSYVRDLLKRILRT